MSEEQEEIPALSPSIAHVLLEESPKHAWTIHRLLGNQPRPVTDGQEKGKILHSLLLGGAEIAVIDAKDFRTKEAQAQRDAARAAGKIPIVNAKLDEYESIAEDARHKLREKCGIDLSEYEAEKRIEWLEPTLAGNDVLCHGVLDLISDDSTHILDLKILLSGRATAERCARALLGSHGILQAPAYKRAVEQAHPELIGRVEVEYLFLEATAPFDIRHAELSGAMQEIAATRWTKAVDLWAACLHNDHWPGFADEGLTRLEAPQWAIARDLGHIDDEEDD